VIFCALDYLRDVGLTPDDIVVKISSREMLAELLLTIGIADSKLEDLYAVLDKRSRLPNDTFEKMLVEKVPDENKRKKILELMAVESIEQINDLLELTDAAKESVDELGRLFELLDVMGVGDYCVFNIGIVRGLAYYTGIVFEIYDKTSELRAIGGGGRYDNLLKQLGGPSIPAAGFGIGDCVLGILLEEKGILKGQLPAQKMDYFVAFVDEAYRQNAIKLTMKLRSAGLAANFSYKAAKLSRQLKEASDKNAKKCIIIGEEFKNNQLVIKDMAAGKQELVKIDDFLSRLNC
jgi:histidyl-tRNA synthetase